MRVGISIFAQHAFPLHSHRHYQRRRKQRQSPSVYTVAVPLLSEGIPEADRAWLARSARAEGQGWHRERDQGWRVGGALRMKRPYGVQTGARGTGRGLKWDTWDARWERGTSFKTLVGTSTTSKSVSKYVQYRQLPAGGKNTTISSRCSVTRPNTMLGEARRCGRREKSREGWRWGSTDMCEIERGVGGACARSRSLRSAKGTEMQTRTRRVSCGG